MTCNFPALLRIDQLKSIYGYVIVWQKRQMQIYIHIKFFKIMALKIYFQYLFYFEPNNLLYS